MINRFDEHICEKRQLMFSGIVEAITELISSERQNEVLRIKIRRPNHFDDLKLGDSISVNGICLTVEAFNQEYIQFALGHETLKIIGDSISSWLKRPMNLERSIRFGDRIHGHLVTGHVDCFALVTQSQAYGENWLVTVQLSADLPSFVWVKGAIAINGVSLTVNTIENSPGRLQAVSVCLIPETIQRTNLSRFEVGDQIAIEFDYLAKAYLNNQKNRGDLNDAL